MDTKYTVPVGRLSSRFQTAKATEYTERCYNAIPMSDDTDNTTITVTTDGPVTERESIDSPETTVIARNDCTISHVFAMDAELLTGVFYVAKRHTEVRPPNVVEHVQGLLDYETDRRITVEDKSEWSLQFEAEITTWITVASQAAAISQGMRTDSRQATLTCDILRECGEYDNGNESQYARLRIMDDYDVEGHDRDTILQSLSESGDLLTEDEWETDAEETPTDAATVQAN